VVLAETLSPDSQLATTASEGPVILFGDSDLGAVLKELGSRSIQSVLVEGGATVAGEFVDAGLVNKVTFFIAPKIVGGTEAPSAVGGKGVEMMSDALELQNVTVTQRGKDIEITGYPRRTIG
jgi:diaminohydroxyphosphoribosylaminopyrimidine deaminase/5-amino-6-(5-phosphoribosylamino)uracil reductase